MLLLHSLKIPAGWREWQWPGVSPGPAPGGEETAGAHPAPRQPSQGELRHERVMTVMRVMSDAGPEDGECHADLSWHSELQDASGQPHQPLRQLGPGRQRLRGESENECQENKWICLLQVGLVWDTDTGTKQHMVREPVYDCQVIMANKTNKISFHAIMQWIFIIFFGF